MTYKEVKSEIISLIRMGKKTGDMKLKNLARNALFALESDDGTPGLGFYLWKHEVLPNLREARVRAKYIKQTMNAINVAIILGNRRRSLVRQII